MTTPTTPELLRTLAAMLPDVIRFAVDDIYWVDPGWSRPVYPTELRHLVDLAEEKMRGELGDRYLTKLAVIYGDDFWEHKTHWSSNVAFATWQQRVIALSQVTPLVAAAAKPTP